MTRHNARQNAEARRELKEEAERVRQADARRDNLIPDAIERLRKQNANAIKELRAALDRERTEQDERHRAELARMQKGHDAYIKSLNAEIGRLVALIPDTRKREEGP